MFIYCGRADEADTQGLLSEVSPARAAKYERFKCKSKGVSSLLAEALLIRLLRERYGVDYIASNKYLNEYGKEYFTDLEIYYNISHTDTFACVAASSGEVGVDCETVRRVADVLSLSARFYTPDEHYIVASAEDCEDMFFRIWTMKEAYIKYLGTGFSTPLNTFSVCPTEDVCSYGGAFIKTYREGNTYISVCSGEDCFPQEYVVCSTF